MQNYKDLKVWEKAHAFLNIAVGSANEAEYFILLSKDLNYLSLEKHNELSEYINEIKAMLISLIGKSKKHLKRIT